MSEKKLEKISEMLEIMSLSDDDMKPAYQLQEKSIAYSKYPYHKRFNTNIQYVLFILLVTKNETYYKSLKINEIFYIARELYNFKHLNRDKIAEIINSSLGLFFHKRIRKIKNETSMDTFEITDVGLQALNLNGKISSNSIDKILLLPLEIFKKSKGYIKDIVLQINGCYSHNLIDACASMIRKLIETLIIEIYEAKKIENELKRSDGTYHHLEKIINKVASDNKLNLSQNAIKLMKNGKFLGDIAVHNRRCGVLKSYLDEIKKELRVTITDLVKILENP